MRNKKTNKRKSQRSQRHSTTKNLSMTITEMDSIGKRRNPENEINRLIVQLEPQDEDRFYVIEKLLDKRTNSRGEEEYLVRWQNYPPDWDSWEPREELERNSSDMINEFNRKTDGPTADARLHCVCRTMYRFDQGGMIQCINCRTWYHFSCLQMNMEEANSYLRYYCQECKAKDSSLKNLIKTEKLNTYYGRTILRDDS